MCRTQGPTLWSAIWKQPPLMMSRLCCPGLTRWCLRPAQARAVACLARTPSTRAASVLMADAAERAGVARFVQISSMGAGQPPQPGTGEVWAAYIAAKTAAEDDLRSRDLDWTILRPGHLTDAPATAKIRLAAPPVPAGPIPRADVAAVIAALLDEPGTAHQTLELVGGDSPVDAAVGSIS